jgi:hypothetical protein
MNHLHLLEKKSIKSLSSALCGMFPTNSCWLSGTSCAADDFESPESYDEGHLRSAVESPMTGCSVLGPLLMNRYHIVTKIITIYIIYYHKALLINSKLVKLPSKHCIGSDVFYALMYDLLSPVKHSHRLRLPYLPRYDRLNTSTYNSITL